MKQELSQESLEQFPLAIDALPDGWSIAFLADVAHSVSPGFASGKHDSDGNGYPHMRPMNIDRSGRIDLTVVKSVPSTEGRTLSAGDILFNNTNSPDLVGKTALIGDREAGFAFSNHMTRVRVDESISPDYVAHYLQFLWVSGYMKHRCTNHVNQASISSNTLAQTVPLLVPPSSEQLRIVEKLEELLSDLDAGVAELKAAQRKLAQYRQSLLKAAVEGTLTADWRATQGPLQETGAELLQRILTERRTRWEQKQLAKFEEQGKTPPKGWQAKYPEPASPDLADLTPLPASWTWTCVDQLSPDDLANGRSVPTAEAGAKVLRLTAVRDGRIDLAEWKHGAWSEEDAQPFAVTEGDLLIVRGNGSLALVGRAGLVGPVEDQTAYPDTLIRLRTLDAVVRPAWISLTWDSEVTRTHLERRARSSAGIYKISQPDIVSVLVPIPPLAEQDRILKMLEEHRENIGSAASALDMRLKQAAAQRKNLLKAAFAGQLVPQDSNDEPASKLLERIRQARADQPKPKRTRQMKKTSQEIKDRSGQIRTWIENKDFFTFDELRANVPAPYQDLKESLFKLLAETPPSIEQEFASNAGVIRFRRIKK